MLKDWSFFNVQPTITTTAAITQPGVVRYTPAGGAFTATIAAALVKQAGQTLIFKNVANNTTTLTIATEGAETIDGANTITNSTAYGRVILISDGTNWMTILNT